MLNFPHNLASSLSIAPEGKQPIEFLNYVPVHYPFKQRQQNNIGLLQKLEHDFDLKEKDILHSFFAFDQDKFNIIPKKSNIDLKRHLQEKLDKITRRNEMAIVDILTQKMNITEIKEKEQGIEKEEQQELKRVFGREQTYQEQILEEEQEQQDNGLDGDDLVNGLQQQDCFYESLGVELENDE